MNILVVGDWIQDKYVFCKQTRVNPEGPIPLLEQERVEYRWGGALAVARLCHELGADVQCIGNRLPPEDYCEGVQLLRGADDTPMPLKTRYICGGRQVLRVDDEEVSYPFSLSKKTWDSCLEWCDRIVVSDYGKGMITGAFMQGVHSSSKPVFADPGVRNVSFYVGCHLLKMNRDEAKVAARRSHFDGDMVDALRSRLQVSELVVTLDSQGMAFSSRDTSGQVGAVQHQVADPTGAGDTVLAALACTEGTLEERCREANRLAGIQVTRIGVSSCLPSSPTAVSTS